MLRALIVDDESNGRKILHILLSKHCPDIKILGSCDSVSSAKKMIQDLRPNLLFLDIKLGHESSFEILEEYPCPTDHVHIIFTTAYSEFALKAIKNDAIDYLLKPIDYKELIVAVNKVQQKFTQNSGSQYISNSKPLNVPKIKLVNRQGFELVDLSEILYCKGEINYTHFHFKSKKPILTSKTLKSYQEFIEQWGFLRVHKSYIVNLNEIVQFANGKTASITLTNKESIPVGKEYKANLLKRLEN